MINNIKLPPQEWLGYDPELGEIHGYTFEQMREFAELIVQEMLKLLEQYSRDSFPEDIMDDFDNAYLAGLRNAREAVKKHFGVEE